MATMNVLPFMNDERTGIFPLKHSTRRKPKFSDIPTTSVSIPSRYRTVVSSNTEAKGFNSQSTRFVDLNINCNPGPGTYFTTLYAPTETSYSKRGVGGCASMNQRFGRERSQNIGPGSYNPQPVQKHQDFSQANSSSYFQSRIAVPVFDEKKQTPAPNAYNLRGEGRNTLVTGEAAFKSKIGRGLFRSDLVSNPAPCQYRVIDTLLHPSSCPYNSIFKSKSNRSSYLTTNKGPGPADYDTHIGMGDPTSLSTMGNTRGFHNYKGKNSLLISVPALPRSSIPPPPGPGHYNVHGKMAMFQDKRAVTGAVFKSVTGRWLSSPKTYKYSHKLGPAYYNPFPEERKSYMYNLQHAWI